MWFLEFFKSIVDKTEKKLRSDNFQANWNILLLYFLQFEDFRKYSNKKYFLRNIIEISLDKNIIVIK